MCITVTLCFLFQLTALALVNSSELTTCSVRDGATVCHIKKLFSIYLPAIHSRENVVIEFNSINHVVNYLPPAWQRFPNIKSLLIEQAPGKAFACNDTFFEHLFNDSILKSNLEQLTFLNVPVLCTVPSVLKEFSKLERLEFIKTGLNVLSLYNMPSLHHLKLFGNRLKYISEGSFSNLPSLSHLVTENENVQWRSRPFTEVADSLEHLAVINCSVDDAVIRNSLLQHMPNLRQLDLSNNLNLKMNFHWDDHVFDHFPALKILNLSGAKKVERLDWKLFNGDGTKTLEHLHLDFTGLTEFNVVMLQETPKLQKLTLRNTTAFEKLTFEPAPQSMEHMPNKTKIDLSGSSIGTIERGVAKLLNCSNAQLILTNCFYLKCSRIDDIEWMKMFQDKTENLKLDNAECGRNRTKIVDVVRKVPYARFIPKCKASHISTTFTGIFVVSLFNPFFKSYFIG